MLGLNFMQTNFSFFLSVYYTLAFWVYLKLSALTQQAKMEDGKEET